ncbi:Protein-glutamate O-methyltransferase [Apiospora saccharicola]|uniref:Sugar phosphate phosphatase n=1 Tax=Apiospora saccharicola TaxID=335842 RepID=A0ABR1VBF8_9PEZI
MSQAATNSSPASYSTADPSSFGYETARTRWPIIVTGVVDDLTKAVFQHAHVQEKVDEGSALIATLQTLKTEILEGATLCPLVDDGSPEIASYNAELAAAGRQTWHSSPWLFCECYLFKRISTSFRLSGHWQEYDAFMNQKMSTFKSSQPAVAELAARYRGISSSQNREGLAAQAGEELVFREIFEICLWGNATDLSLLTNLSYEDIQKLQGSAARKAAESNILANDLSQVYSKLKGAGGSSRVDIVLDNSGFELYVDLLLAGYLLSSGLAREVVFHPKNIPWFVSDVTPVDFKALLGVLSKPVEFFGPEDTDNSFVEDLSFLSSQLESFRKEGRLSLRTSPFWTLPCGFAALPREDPPLFGELRTSDLVIFKGDLNYRKLTGDRAWSPTTPFLEAITAPAPSWKQQQGDDGGNADANASSSSSLADLNVLALRTCKADVAVGLPSGKDEELRTETDPEYTPSAPLSGPRRWAWSGKWAVVQFSEAR